MLLRLELQRSQAEDILLDQRGLRISVQVTRRFLEKLEAAAINYEQAVTKLIIFEEMDSNSRMVYTNKLREQQKLTNPIIGRLQGAIDFLKISDRTAQVMACMQAKIHSMHKRIKTKITVVQTTHEEEGLLFSLDQIKADI